MGFGLWDKLMSLIGYDDDLEDEDAEDLAEEEVQTSSYERGRTKVLSIHSHPEMKIMVAAPINFDDSEKLAGYLKNRKPLIVNFENASKESAQRIIDFLSGAVTVLNGTTMKVTADTFLFVPSNISVQTDQLAQDLGDKLFFRLEQGGSQDRYQEKG
jgi:cell division inhibitor SepF